jgi:hypothetical protein
MVTALFVDIKIVEVYQWITIMPAVQVVTPVGNVSEVYYVVGAIWDWVISVMI